MNARPVKVSVIGAGWYAAENHIPVLRRRPEVQLDGVCRLGAAEVERVREHFGFAFASEDYRALLARGPDAVVVSSPHALHYEHARDALEAGAHVLCEKPFTLEPRHAWDLVARAQRLDRHLLIANGYHYLPKLDEIARRVWRGDLGTIEQVSCQFSSATRPVFSGTVGFERWNRTFFRPALSTWQDPAAGGGFAFGQLSHSIALALWITGLRGTQVSALTFGENGIDLHDAAVVQFDNGAIGTFSGGASVPEGRRARLRLSVAGSKGIADVDVDLDRCAFDLLDVEPQMMALAPGEWTYTCSGPVDRLVDLALGYGENLSPGHIGAKTVELIQGLLASAAAGATPMVIADAAASDSMLR